MEKNIFSEKTDMEMESITFKISRKKFVLFKNHCTETKKNMSEKLRGFIDNELLAAGKIEENIFGDDKESWNEK